MEQPADGCDQTDGCGTVHSFYTTVRDGDSEAVREEWDQARAIVAAQDEKAAETIDTHLAAGETEAVRQILADLLYVDDEESRLDGPLATIVGTLLYGFGYVVAHVLFIGVDSRTAVKERLRSAYRAVGVDIRATESVDGTERTVFCCPYRNIGAERYGERRVCHDILDRVDDGYVTYLDRHRDLTYDRPRRCAGGECCCSEVSGQD